MSVLMGIDIGTSSLKVIAMDETGAIRASAAQAARASCETSAEPAVPAHRRITGAPSACAVSST